MSADGEKTASAVAIMQIPVASSLSNTLAKTSQPRTESSQTLLSYAETQFPIYCVGGLK